MVTITDFRLMPGWVLAELIHDVPPFRVFRIAGNAFDNTTMTLGDLITIHPSTEYQNITVGEKALALLPASAVLGVVTVSE